jgi:hypothetical protein
MKTEKYNYNETIKEIVNKVVDTYNASEDAQGTVNSKVYFDDKKKSTGALTWNIKLTREDMPRKKQVYSIYLTNCGGNNAIHIVDSSAYNFQLLFFNCSDNTQAKSEPYIESIVKRGIKNLFIDKKRSQSTKKISRRDDSVSDKVETQEEKQSENN